VADTERPELRFYRLHELEIIAEHELEGTEEYFNSYRCDIESLIIKKYGLIITTHAYLKTNHDTYAYTVVGLNRIFIDSQLMDEDRLEKKYRFTLGEELGHYLIHRNIFSECKNVDERNEIYFSLSEKDRKYLDGDARALGSAVLMPKKMVYKRVIELLPELNTKPTKILDSLATQLAHDFDVNFMPAKIRLEQLGYDRTLS